MAQENTSHAVTRPRIIQTGVLALWMVKPLLGGVLSLHFPNGRIHNMFGPVITSEAHLAFSGARTTPLK